MKTENITPPLPSGVLTVPTLPLCTWATQSLAAFQVFNIGHGIFLAMAMPQQCREEDQCAHMLVIPNASIDGAILHIHMEYDTYAAPLNALYAEYNHLWKDWHDKMACYDLGVLKCQDTLILGCVLTSDFGDSFFG